MTANLTKIAGRHTLKYGGEFRRSSNDDVWSGQGGGVFGFNTTATNDSLAALLLGWTNSGSRAEAPLIRSRANTFGAFIQDDWKVTPRLTLNLGIRWDLDWPRWEAVDNRQNSFDRYAINPVSGTPGVITWSGRNGLSRYAHNFDKNKFGPRAGFAFRLTDKWIIRGGAATLFIGQYDQATPIVANIGFGYEEISSRPMAGVLLPFFSRTDSLSLHLWRNQFGPRFRRGSSGTDPEARRRVLSNRGTGRSLISTPSTSTSSVSFPSKAFSRSPIWLRWVTSLDRLLRDQSTRFPRT